MTLCEAITAVPQLGSSCSLILTDEDLPGSGIKVMRLVSKQLRTTMLDFVQGYTLNLDGNGAGLLDQMTVLHSTRLSRLCVVVTNDMDGGRLAGLNGWDAHTLNLRCFLSGMGGAIRDITRLEMDTQTISRMSMDAVAVLLSQLAPTCPALQQVRVTGKIGRGFFAALGVTCSKLSCLEISQTGSGKALQQLHLILPSLTHCKVACLAQIENMIPPAKACCLSLLSCTSLTFLDIGLSSLTLPMWLALPAGLKELRCSVDCEEDRDNPPPDLTSLANLEHLRCYCNRIGNHVMLVNLVPVLRLAPKLQTLTVSGYGTDTEDSSLVSEIFSNCESANISDMVYLHNRLSSGLVVTSTLCIGGGHFSGLNLSLGEFFDEEVDYDEVQFQNFSEFLTALPPFPAFTGLTLASDRAQPSLLSITTATAASFPNLKSLVVDFPATVTSEALIHLGAFTALQHLSLSNADVSPASLAVLCTRMPFLETLRLQRCSRLTAQDEVSLQSALRGWGLGINVVVVRAQ